MKLLDYIFAARPMLHLPVWTVYLVGLHYHHRLSGESFGRADVLMMGLLSLLFAGAFYINQVFDQESDRINEKGHFLQDGIIRSGEMMLAYLVCSMVALTMALIVFSNVTLAVFLQIVVLAYIYSVGPLRLKDHPFGGLLANMYAHGWLVALAVMPDMTVHNTGLLGWDNPFYFALSVGAVYVFTTIPDVPGDRLSGKTTLAVKYGKRPALMLAFLLLALATIIAYRSGFAPLVYLSLFSAIITLMAVVIPARSLILAGAKVPLLLLTLLAGYWYPVYLLFVVALLVVTRIYYRRRFGMLYPRLA